MKKFKTFEQYRKYIRKNYCIYCDDECKHLPECKKIWEKADYKGFILHLRDYKKLGIPYGLNDLRRLARFYNCEIPKEFKQKGD